MSMVKIDNVIKRYNKKLAVDNLSINIEEKEVFGLLGPNGAGKSTTMKMLLGITKPSFGEIDIKGYNIAKASEAMKAKKIIGYVPQDIAVHEDMSARDNVNYFAGLYGVRGGKLKEYVDEALDFVGLYDRQKDKAKTFSGGMKRRLNIACAIAHRPELIIMDEPTVGIDPQSRNHILESVKKLNKRGSTIIYTSHYMEEIEAVCTQIGIMDKGRLIALGTLDELKATIQNESRIEIEAEAISYNLINDIDNIPNVIKRSVDNDLINIVTKNGQGSLSDILLAFDRYDVKIRKINITEPNLESLFLSLTGKKLRD